MRKSPTLPGNTGTTPCVKSCRTTTLDEDLSSTQALVFKDNATGKGVLVFRGANAGHDETESGQAANARDQQSYTQAFTNPKHNEASLYPGVDEQIQGAITKYGGVDNVESVSYSNGGLLGHYTNREYGIRGTAFDPVVGLRQTGDWLSSGMRAPMQYVRTTTTPIAMSPSRPSPHCRVRALPWTRAAP